MISALIDRIILLFRLEMPQFQLPIFCLKCLLQTSLHQKNSFGGYVSFAQNDLKTFDLSYFEHFALYVICPDKIFFWTQSTIASHSLVYTKSIPQEPVPRYVCVVVHIQLSRINQLFTMLESQKEKQVSSLLKRLQTFISGSRNGLRGKGADILHVETLGAELKSGLERPRVTGHSRVQNTPDHFRLISGLNM